MEERIVKTLADGRVIRDHGMETVIAIDSYGNNYDEGSEEWVAWGAGNDYAKRQRDDLNDESRDGVLSGEWADEPTLSWVYTEVAQRMGFDELDPDSVEFVGEAWERGFLAWRYGIDC